MIQQNTEIQQDTEEVDFLDSHCTSFPDPRRQFELFRSDWQHFLLEQDDETLELTEDRLLDQFVPFCSDCLGGMKGLSVLELGPYEGFHSHALQKAGVKEAFAIEGNPRNFLKCLIVKNYYQLRNITFLLGDFTKYLESADRKFDFILAAGVLYHLTDPLVALDNMMKLTDAIGVCTTYYDEDNQHFNYTGRTRSVRFPGAEPFVLHERHNPDGTRAKKSGLYETAWMFSRETLLSFLDSRGFDVIIREPPKNPKESPRIQLFAKRRNAGSPIDSRAKRKLHFLSRRAK